MLFFACSFLAKKRDDLAIELKDRKTTQNKKEKKNTKKIYIKLMNNSLKICFAQDSLDC
jgi:hypothetical protein